MTRPVHAFFRFAYVQFHSLKGLNFFEKADILRFMPNSVSSMCIHAVPICFFGNDTAINKTNPKGIPL